MTLEEAIRSRYKTISLFMNERATRLWAAMEAREQGRGGVSLVHRATGFSRSMITQGLRELKTGKIGPTDENRSRRYGGGRKRITESEPTLKKELLKLVDVDSRGDPMSPLRWTSKSTRNLADELVKLGFNVSYRTVSDLLSEMGYSLQGNRKMLEGASHPDRNAQFEFINERVKKFQDSLQPVISVDTKKKELIGDFKNSGKEWKPKGDPEKVRVHDFEYKNLGKGIPYGVYDVNSNEGWVSVGTDHDTAEFAVATIRRWWKKMGSKSYPNATKLLITADSGGSNGSRVKLWKLELSKFARDSGLKISVSHLPPGTSKWNKIEHKLFSQITQNWRGRPLLSHQVMVNLIAATTTRSGLKVKAELDSELYEKGIKISKEEFSEIKLKPDSFHGDWNYTIYP